MDKIISIVSSTYNQGKYIAETLHSVISQEGDFWLDYIIVDAMSDDNTSEEIEKVVVRLKVGSYVENREGLEFFSYQDEGSVIQCKGVSVRWVREKDNGTADGINKGLAMAKGHVFAYLNTDDIYYRHALDNILEYFDKYPEADVIYGNSLYIDEKSEVVGMYPPQDIAKKSLDVNCVISQPSAFVKKEVLDKEGGFNEAIRNSFDYELWLRLFHRGYKFRFVPEVLSATRLHDQTKTRLNRADVHLESFAAIAQHAKHIPLEAKAIFTNEMFILGKISRVLLRLSEKLQYGFMHLFAPWYFARIKDKVVAKQAQIFPKHENRN